MQLGKKSANTMAVIAQEGCRGYEEARFTPNHHQEQAAQVRKGVETAPIISKFYTLITGTYGAGYIWKFFRLILLEAFFVI